jgi:hypothetical protein
MNFIRMTAILAVTLTAFACNEKYNSENSADVKSTAAQKELAIAGEKPEDERKADGEGFHADTVGKQQFQGDKQKQQQRGEPDSKPDWDKKIIKTALLNAEVKDYNAFYASLREKVRAVGGYIAQEEQIQTGYKIENSLTIKVPVDQFENAIAQLTSHTLKINEKKISSRDVTVEVVDTKSRLEAKKQVRLRYMDLLKQAKNMEEILSVQSEINGIQEEIESAAGRIEYLGHSSTFSTIHLTYYQVLDSSAKNEDSPSFGTKLSNAFKTGWSWIGDLFVGLVSIWPLFLLIFTGIIIYKKTKVQKPRQA